MNIKYFCVCFIDQHTIVCAGALLAYPGGRVRATQLSGRPLDGERAGEAWRRVERGGAAAAATDKPERATAPAVC